ncbi:MAG TPA: hypothetical protein PLJ60_06180 [Chryseolinea sp.]|nr:hypothetical protein [Chryseolinea sp.]HPH46434.1 hypothetical protein [Chryseolinea sp.]HPM29906.1 hypothetical protein [Chryseolinea sp.]
MLNKIVVMMMLCVISFTVYAQSGDSPVDHMSFFTTREGELSKKYLSYMSEAAHGNRARKIEKKRQEIVLEIKQSLAEVNRLRPYKGDASLRNAYKNYWDILLKVFNEDYGKIVNMEEIAEQSYDKMEAYLLAQEKAGEVLEVAHDSVEVKYESFAARNNVTLIHTDTKMSKKMRQVGRVNHYYHELYLIFFKSYKQEAYVMDAINRKDINSVEQNNSTLIRFAEEGITRLDTVKAFNGDGSLINNCKKVLAFHKLEAEKYIPVMSDYLLKADEFEKIKKAYDAKPSSKRTQTDIDAYNKAVNQMNEAVNKSNSASQALYAGNQKVLDGWNQAVKNFMEHYVPKGK